MNEMKDSGIAWIGKIPKSWGAIRAKFLFTNAKEIVGETNDEYERLSLTMQGVLKRSKDENKGLQPEKFDTYQILRPNELVFKLIDLQNISTSRVGLSLFLGIVSSAYIILRNKQKDNRYFQYQYLSLYYRNIFNSLGGDGVRSALNPKDLLEMKITVPPLSTQTAIADFLDDKCGKIDTLIANEEKTIAELKDAIRAEIRKCVKRGIFEHEIVSTNSIWITEIPKDWKILRGKYVLKQLSRKVFDSDTVITCFRDGEVTLRSNRREDGFTMADLEIGYQGIEIGDLVIHGMDGFAGAIGISDARGKGSPILNVCDSKENKKYLMYYLRCLAYDDVFTALATGVRVRSCDLRWNKLANMDFAIPTKQEQDLIVEKIEERIAKIKNLIDVKVQKIAELKEYKKSLIYEYATGKREVM